MQTLTKFTKILGNAPGIVRRLAQLSTRRTSAGLADDLRRELYGMSMREQAVVRQVISMAGQVVTVRLDTIAFGKKSRPCYLEKGSQVKISKNPLRLEPEGGVQVIVLDQSNKYLSITLSDYIRDIYINDQ
jgi:hypothetical protein